MTSGPEAARQPGEPNCTRCGAAFACGCAAGAETCWCAEMPPAMPLPDAAGGCYCPQCLRRMIAQRHEGTAPQP